MSFASNRNRPLDKVVAILKEQADWKFTVEGHTDNVGGETFNQLLSEKRAASVKKYLTADFAKDGKETQVIFKVRLFYGGTNKVSIKVSSKTEVPEFDETNNFYQGNLTLNKD